MSVSITYGNLHILTDEERERYPHAKYATESVSVCAYGDKTITVPIGFLTDGNSGFIDYGRSWLFHDWLYSHHFFDDGEECTREEADKIMAEILKMENMNVLRFGFKVLVKINPFYVFSNAWKNSGSRGPQYISPHDDDIDGDAE